MIDLAQLGFFLGATLALLVVPGPAVLYIVSQSLALGRRAGVVATLGMAAGSLVHIVAMALGISALVAASPVAFAAVRYAGAAYLVYLAVHTLMAPAAEPRAAEATRAPLGQVFHRGFWVSLLNPKAILFFLAFLPQFVDPQRGSPALQVLVLGTLFQALAFTTDNLWVLAAGHFSRTTAASPRLARLQRYATAAVYLGLGLATALAGRG
ncbi:MAG TPA: LysE family translocator [Thermoanaerobaculia bacterium]|nr:LysE family translocator [Thermoanaerobaculia bacterium]